MWKTHGESRSENDINHVMGILPGIFTGICLEYLLYKMWIHERDTNR
jgi:hypothetical protein